MFATELGYNNFALLETAEDNAKRIRESKKQNFLAWIPATQTKDEQKDKTRRLVPGTGSWILTHDHYPAWEAATTSTILWVQGKRGSDKSYLSSVIIRSLQELFENHSEGLNSEEGGDRRSIGMALLYCNSLKADEFDFVKLLSSVAHQIYAQLPPMTVVPKPEQLHDRHGTNERSM